MSKEQRAMLDAMLRQPRPDGPSSIEDLRLGFRTTMATMLVPDGIRATATTLGPRPALLVEPAERARAGTILYFHGGSFVFGSPETALSLTGNLVARTGIRALSLDYRLAPSIHSQPRSTTRSAPIAPCSTAARILGRSRSPGTPPAAV
jgi:acetyl esterase/lipase